MNIQELYKQKLTSAKEAVQVIKSGDWVDYGWAVTTPIALDKALSERANELEDVKCQKCSKLIQKANTFYGIRGMQVVLEESLSIRGLDFISLCATPNYPATMKKPLPHLM